MATARIYRPSKTTMQSGRAGTRQWLLEFEPAAARRPDSLMGWAGSSDVLSQVRLAFPSLDDATAYAEREGLAYEVQEPRERRAVPKSYSANFR